MIEEILDRGIEYAASDIHINSDDYVRYRVDGVLKGFDKNIIIDTDRLLEIKRDILAEEEINIYEDEFDLDFSLDYKNFRVRGYIFRQRNRDSIVFRLISKKIPEIEELFLPDVIKNIARYREGLILITGPTGSGKSTTMAAVINYINNTLKKHIIIMEEPIEYVYENIESIINQREIGKDLLSYEKGIVKVLRADPDIIVLGEIRDENTMSKALTLAETGHLILGTLHTKSVPETIDRVVDFFPGQREKQVRVQLSNSIRMIISQRLYGGKKGGRVPSCEIMVANNGIRNLIREGSSPNAILDQIYMNTKELGCQTKLQSIKQLLIKDLIEIDILENELSDEELKYLKQIL